MRIKVKGFTLIEIIITITLISILSVIVSRVLINNFKAILTYQYASEVDWQLLVGMERIVNDIRSIRSFSDVTTISANSFTFTDYNGNAITYSLSGSSLMRNATMLANNITGLTFTYLNSSGVTTATASAVRYVTVTLSATVGTFDSSLSTMVAVRE